jgi:hypothetical protein
VESIGCEILWPGGQRRRAENLRPGASYVIIEPSSSDQPPQVFEVPR